jgi:hypothetical protein
VGLTANFQSLYTQPPSSHSTPQQDPGIERPQPHITCIDGAEDFYFMPKRKNQDTTETMSDAPAKKSKTTAKRGKKAAADESKCIQFFPLLTLPSLSGRGVEVRSSMEIATLMPRKPCTNGGANGGLVAGRLQLLCCLHAASHRYRCRCSNSSTAQLRFFAKQLLHFSICRHPLRLISSLPPLSAPPRTNPTISHTRPPYISISYNRVGNSSANTKCLQPTVRSRRLLLPSSRALRRLIGMPRYGS